MRSAVLLIVAAMACGPSAAEVKTAKTATYRHDAHALLGIAIEATQGANYKIGDVNEAELGFITAAQWYSPEGGMQSPGAEGFVNVDDRSVQVAFIVLVVPTGDTSVITVTPKTFQHLSGSPKPRELKPDDPNLPPFVLGRAEALQVAIYNAAKQYAVK